MFKKFLIIFLFLGFSSFAFAEGSSNMSKTQYVVGGILGTYPGFGIGHIVQGRWLERGYIFTLGETTSLVVASVGLAQCTLDTIADATTNDKIHNCHNGAITTGLVGFFVFKIWEIYDVWASPVRNNSIAEHHRKYYFEIEPPEKNRPMSLAFNLSF